MGKWAQQNKRGSDRVQTVAAYELEPPEDTDWHVASAALQFSAAMDGPCPEGADGVGVQWQTTGPAWTDEPDIVCGDGETLVDPCDFNDVYYARIRWLLGGVPVSDWSNPQSITCNV